MDLDGTLFDEDVVTPDVVEQLRPRIDAFRMGHEEEEQAEFGRPQFNRLFPAGHPMRRRVELESADLDGFASQVRRAPTQDGAHAGDQLSLVM